MDSLDGHSLARMIISQLHHDGFTHAALAVSDSVQVPIMVCDPPDRLSQIAAAALSSDARNGFGAGGRPSGNAADAPNDNAERSRGSDGLDLDLPEPLQPKPAPKGHMFKTVPDHHLTHTRTHARAHVGARAQSRTRTHTHTCARALVLFSRERTWGQNSPLGHQLLWIVAVRIFGEPAQLTIGDNQD